MYGGRGIRKDCAEQGPGNSECSYLFRRSDYMSGDEVGVLVV